MHKLVIVALAGLSGFGCKGTGHGEDQSGLFAPDASLVQVDADPSGVGADAGGRLDGSTRPDAGCLGRSICAIDVAPDRDAAVDALVDAGVDAPVDANPPDARPPDAPPPACTPDDATTYGDITVIRQPAPAKGNWVRVAFVSWNSKDATRKAATAQATIDKNVNLAVIERFAVGAKKQCAELLVFPEMAVVGYPTKASDSSAFKTANFRSKEEAAGYLESVPAVGTARADINANNFPASRKLADSAATNGVAIHAGLLEANDTNNPYNTTLIFDKEGKLIARHRKHNIKDPMPLNDKETEHYYEDCYLSAGADATIYTHPKIGSVGVMTCADLYPQMDQDEKIIEPWPYWREKYKTSGFAFMSVSAAWNDPWKTPPNLAWTAMNQVELLSDWANAGMNGMRYVGFANTVSNGKEVDKGYTALVAPGKIVNVQTDADKKIIIGYVPAP